MSAVASESHGLQRLHLGHHCCWAPGGGSSRRPRCPAAQQPPPTAPPAAMRQLLNCWPAQQSPASLSRFGFTSRTHAGGADGCVWHDAVALVKLALASPPADETPRLQVVSSRFAHLARPGGLPPPLEPGREVGGGDKAAVEGQAVGGAAKALQQGRWELGGLQDRHVTESGDQLSQAEAERAVVSVSHGARCLTGYHRTCEGRLDTQCHPPPAAPRPTQQTEYIVAGAHAGRGTRVRRLKP